MDVLPIKEIVIAVILVMLGGAMFFLKRSGRLAEREAAAARETKEILDAQAVERAVAREPDPVGKLHDDWQRP